MKSWLLSFHLVLELVVGSHHLANQLSCNILSVKSHIWANVGNLDLPESGGLVNSLHALKHHLVQNVRRIVLVFEFKILLHLLELKLLSGVLLHQLILVVEILGLELSLLELLLILLSLDLQVSLQLLSLHSHLKLSLLSFILHELLLDLLLDSSSSSVLFNL